MNIAESVLSGFRKDPKRQVLECDDELVNGAQALAYVSARARMLRDLGIDMGQTVLVASGRKSRFWLDLVSLWSIGAVPVPIEAAPCESHVRTIIAKAAPVWMLGDATGLGDAGLGVEDLPELQMVEDGEFAIPREVSAGDEAIVIFTSGSTGVPKGVSLSHQALLENMNGVHAVLDIQSHDRLFAAIPFRFASAICHFLALASGGASFVGSERTYFMGDYIKALKDKQATAAGGSPVQMRWIATAAKDGPLPLKWVMSSGDHLASEVIQDLTTLMPETRLYNVYGLTEVGGRFCIQGPDDHGRKPGSVGRPIDCLDIRVLNDDGDPVPAGIEGYLHAAGNSLMIGYRNDPEITERSLTPQGFVTGDLGYMDEDGHVFVTGRSDDVFKSGGRKVSTVLIADAMMESGAFADVAVCPWEHRSIGRVPVAFYTLGNGNEFNKREIMRHLRASLPVNHIPFDFRQMDAIPRTGSGKLDRGALRALVNMP